MTARIRRLLAALIVGAAFAFGAAALVDQPVAAGPAADHCKPKPCNPFQTPVPTANDTSTPAPPASGEVQGISVPTATPFDDTHATPGPITGTLLTPQAAAASPVAAAPTLVAHPQAEGGLAALLIVAVALAVITVGSVTVALALR